LCPTCLSGTDRGLKARSLAAVAAPDIAGRAEAVVLEATAVACDVAATEGDGDSVRSGEEGDASEGGREMIEGIMALFLQEAATWMSGRVPWIVPSRLQNRATGAPCLPEHFHTQRSYLLVRTFRQIHRLGRRTLCISKGGRQVPLEELLEHLSEDGCPELQ
jgi:hypothetical protein